MATVDVGRVQHLGSPGEEEENTLENVTKRVRKLREREKKKKKGQGPNKPRRYRPKFHRTSSCKVHLTYGLRLIKQLME